MRILFQEHRLAIILGFASMLIHALPALSHYATKPPGEEFQPYMQGDELTYSVLLDKVCENDGDAFIYEHRQDGFPFLRLPFVLIGTPGNFIGMRTFFILCDFIITPLIFWLAYLLAMEMLDKERFRSSLFALTFTLLFGATSHFATALGSGSLWYAIKYMIPLLSGYANTGFEIPRVPFPLFSVPIYLACLIFLLKSEKGDRKAAVLLGFSLGILFYFRFYDWSFAVAMCGCYCVPKVFRKEYSGVKVLLAALGISFVIAFPGIVEIAGKMSLFPDTYNRANVVDSRNFFSEQFFTGWRSFLLLLPLCALALGKPNRLRTFSMSIVISYLLLSRSTLVTGKGVGPGHWELYNVAPMIIPVLIVTLFCTSVRCFEWKSVRVLCVGLILFYAGQRFFFAGPQLEDPPSLVAEYSEHSKTISERNYRVVFGPPAYFESKSGTYNFVASHATFCSAGNSELMERFLLIERLFGVPESNIEHTIKNPCSDRLYVLAVCPWPKVQGELQRELVRWMDYYRRLPSEPEDLIGRIRLRYKLDCITAFPAICKSGDVERLKRCKILKQVHATENVILFEVVE